MKAVITIDRDVDEIYKVIQPEMSKQKRSEITLKKGDDLVFEIEAEDIPALRASINSIMQSLSVFYKVK